jgi:hypothetical protein
MRAADRIRVAAGEGLGTLGEAAVAGVVAQAGRGSGCGWGRSSGHIGPVVERCSLAAGTGRGVVLDMGSMEGSGFGLYRHTPASQSRSYMTLGRVRAMRPAILLVRLLSIALALRRVALAVALTLLSLVRAIIAIALLAMTATIVVAA